MKILLVHHAWPGEGSGGSETYTRALAHGLRSRGHEVTVLHREADAGRPDHALRETDEDGLRVVAVNNLHRTHPGFEAWNDPSITQRVRELVGEVRPDVVHVGHLSGFSAGVVHASRAAGAAVVFTLHDFATLCVLGQLLDRDLRICPGPSPQRCLGCVGAQVSVPGATPRLLKQVPGAGLAAALLARSGRGADRIAARLHGMRDVLAAADVLLAPSRFLRDRMEALGVRGIEVLPYGHDPLPPVARTPDPQGRVRFGFLGSAIPSKGVHVLAEAYRRLDDPRAALRIHGPFVPYHGDVGYESVVRQILGPQADDVLRGPFAHEERGRVLAALDVLVAPSLWEENAPLVVQEAFQAGLPVVVSGHGGLAECVRDGIDGLHVRPGDPAALAGAMRRLLDDDVLRERLASGVPEVETVSRHAERMEGVYARARTRFAARPGRVGVVVVDHGRLHDATGAIASAADPSLDPVCLLVGNGTPVPEAPAGARALQLAQNRGYAGGANAGVASLAAEGCDRVLVLNNDARLEPGALRRLADALADPAVAAAGPTILGPDGRVESAGMRLDLRSGRHRMNAHGAPAADPDARVDALSGAALMVSVEAWRALGGFEESYFHGFEDADFCLRARGAGYHLALVAGATVRHASGSTLGRAAPGKLAYAVRNHLSLVERLQPAGPWWRAGWVVALHVAHALRQQDVPRVQALRAVARGVGAFRGGRSGPEPV